MKTFSCLLAGAALTALLPQVSCFVSPHNPSVRWKHQSAQLPFTRHVNTVLFADDDTSEDAPDVIQIETLAQEQIAELVEVTFINACMQLAQGYVDVLKLFIVAVKASRERGVLTIAELVQQVNDCPVQTANRPLLPEEVELRTTWIHAIHLMLEYIGHTTPDVEVVANDIDDTVKSTYSAILPEIVARKERDGAVLNTQEFVKEHASLLPDDMDDDLQRQAIVTQTVKVLWNTLVVLEEERLANDDDSTSPATMARPQIPRGKGIN